MPALLELQQRMLRAIVDGDAATDAGVCGLRSTRLDAALSVHRNTVLGGLRDALRQSYPTVAALVGDACFNQVVAAYARAQPPRTACLSLYGDGLADFVARLPATAGLAYLSDVARLDWAIDRAAAAAVDGHSPPAAQIELEGGWQLQLHASLALLQCQYPVDEIRETLARDDERRLAQIDMRPQRRDLALWRHGEAVSVLPLSAIPARFVAALLAGAAAVPALDAVADDAAPDVLMAMLRDEVFTAPYARLVRNDGCGAGAER